MAFTTNVKTTGGKKLAETLKKAEAARKSKVKVGIFSTARYPDGKPVAEVAAIQEFGAPGAGIPERPFFRQSIAIIEEGLPRQLRGIIDPQTMDLDAAAAARVGAWAAGVIRDRIAAFQDPPNSETSILAKGKDDPLVLTGKMRDSVSYETE